MRIPLIRPYLTDEVRAKVLEVLDSGYLTEGPVTRELEAAFRNYIGCRHAIAVTSCTTGLELALRCLGIGPGDEVIVPALSWSTTVWPVIQCGLVPVIVDIDPATFNIDPNAGPATLSTTRSTHSRTLLTN